MEWTSGSPSSSAARQAKAKTNEAALNEAAELVGAAEKREEMVYSSFNSTQSTSLIGFIGFGLWAGGHQSISSSLLLFLSLFFIH